MLKDLIGLLVIGLSGSNVSLLLYRQLQQGWKKPPVSSLTVKSTETGAATCVTLPSAFTKFDLFFNYLLTLFHVIQYTNVVSSYCTKTFLNNEVEQSVDWFRFKTDLYQIMYTSIIEVLVYSIE